MSTPVPPHSPPLSPTPIDLAALSRGGGSAASHVPRPPARPFTRFFLPATIVLAALGLVAYSARESLRSAITVTVAPAVLKAGGSPGGSGSTNTPATEVVQAPGWIEADPSAIDVPALAPGVVKQLFALDGDRVEPGQVVATLIDEEAVLARRRAEAQISRVSAEIAAARAAVGVEVSRSEEARELLTRAEKLAGTGAMAEGEIAARRLKFATQLASVQTAHAAVAVAEADERLARIALEEADLLLSRMRILAPTGGVVLQRMVEPGQRLMLDANNPFAGVVLRLYNPAKLQVRVDVPLADAAKVRIGDAAEISTETLPGRVFTGTLTRFVHEANLQKNTVQVKVSIADPAPELKPEMLAKARITTQAPDATPATGGEVPTNSVRESSLLIPRAALVDVAGATAAVWVLHRPSSAAVKRTVRTGHVSGDTAEVLEGLRIGDRVIVNPPANLSEGARIRPVDAQENH